MVCISNGYLQVIQLKVINVAAVRNEISLVCWTYPVPEGMISVQRDEDFVQHPLDGEVS